MKEEGGETTLRLCGRIGTKSWEERSMIETLGVRLGKMQSTLKTDKAGHIPKHSNFYRRCDTLYPNMHINKWKKHIKCRI